MKNYLKIFLCLIAALAGWARPGFAESAELQISSEKLPHPWQLGFNVDYAMMTREGSSINGWAVGFGASCAFSRRWAFGGDLSLGISPSAGFVSYFTQFDLGILYALTGSDLLRSEDTVRLNGSATVVARSLSQGGIRLQALLSQYFFNSQTASYPFSGIGAVAYYEFPSNSSFNWRLGARIETVSNGQITLIPFRLVLGLRINP